jgi:hypothetical protein
LNRRLPGEQSGTPAVACYLDSAQSLHSKNVHFLDER